MTSKWHLCAELGVVRLIFTRHHMKHSFWTPAFVSLAFILSGCRDEDAQTALTASNARIAQLESDIKNSKVVIRALLSETPSEKRTPLDISTKGYDFIESPAGRLLVSCTDAKPYLDGQKLTLNVGNPFLMTFSGFTLRVRYGPRPPATPPTAAEALISQPAWEATLKTKDVPFTETLAPGTWTKVELALSPAKAEDLGYVDFKILTNQVSLQKTNP